MKNYSIDDAIRGYRWLGHRPKEFTELSAVPKSYESGKDNYEWNCEHKAFPKTWFARNEQDIQNFLERHQEDALLMYGLNPRPRIIKNDRGYAKSALQRDIETVQNYLLDFDLIERNDSEGLWQSRKKFFYTEFTAYFTDLGLVSPSFAFSGAGYHLLFAHAPVYVEEYPDMSLRWKQFIDDLKSAYGDEIENLEMKLDDTSDLRRMVKIYDTRKPEAHARMSRFIGGKRVEDGSLVDHFHKIDLSPEDRRYVSTGTRGPLFNIGDTLPDWFEEFRSTNPKVQELLKGDGKPDNSDTTGLGYDDSLMRFLKQLRETNWPLGDYATILALQENGSVQNSDKDHSYMARTIANALLK